MTIPRLIAVDMDGTFLDSTGDYDRDRFARLYPRLKDAGVQFVAASGNQYWQLRTFFEDYPDVLYVAENGAIVGSYDEVWSASPLSPSAAWGAIETLDAMNGVFVLLCGQESAWALSDNPPDVVNLMRVYYTRLTLVDSWEQVPEPVLKLALACPEDQTGPLMERFAVELPSGIVPTSSGHGSIDLIHADVSKATGLTLLGSRLGIAADEMTVFGDGGNDLSMLALAGTGVAMGNASDAVKAAADVVTGTNDDGGVMDYLERVLDGR